MVEISSQATKHSNSMTDLSICRLCGTEHGIFISIFGSTPDCLRKIEAVVPDVVILKHDSLPKFACHRCVAKVKEFYDFRETCIQTQTSLRKRVPWMSHLDKIDDDRSPSRLTPRPPSPMVTFMANSLAFPYGDPETAAVEVLVLSDDEDGDCGTAQRDPPTSVPVKHQQQERPSVITKEVGTSFRHAEHQAEHRPINFLPNPDEALRTHVGAKLSSDLLDQSQHIPKAQTRLASENFRKMCPASKRPRLQPSSQHSLVNGTLIANNSTTDTKLPVDLKGSYTLSAPPCFSVLSTSSKTLGKVGMPAKKDELLPKMPPAIPIRKERILPQTSNHTKTTESFGNVSNHFSDGLVDGLSLIDSEIEKLSFEKPKPKSKKKKKQTELSKVDCQRICQTYPLIKAVNIVHNSVTIFTCSECNKILVTEDAISRHDCIIKLAHKNTRESTDNGGIIQTAPIVENSVSEEETARACFNLEQSDKSYVQSNNYNANEPVELIVSDDEDSNTSSSFVPKHTCTVCSKQFHSLTRLEKHQVSHNVSL